ncbi:CbtA family protein [Neotabrizicola sp. VNH66]|uniref:CbtA family protein n=1 Tax=Neotabrizicola sp. VNH66 TaxID=3400918 RepID=UPI003C03252A
MTGSLLLRGLIAGVVAGFIAFLFAFTFGEPQVDLAIAFEERMAAAEPAPAVAAEDEAPVVTRATQAGIGLATGLLAIGAALGGLFALVFALVYGRIGTLGARATAGLLALAAFVAIGLVPQLKYPANPPAVGFDETIGARTVLFFAMLAFSVLIMAVSVLTARRLWAQRGGWTAGTLGGAVFLGLTALAFTALPTVNEMPEGFDPLVIWHFRIATMGIHLILWLVIGLGFGWLAERLLEGGRPAPRLAPV